MEGFEATFRIRLDHAATWRRLTAPDGAEPDEHIWLPGFDSHVTVVDVEPDERLRVTKDEEPCAGTDIVVTLEDEESGTRINVVQSRFGDWLPAHYETMAVGWKYIVADLQAYLATGVEPRRHLRPWGDLGAAVTAVDGGVHVTGVREHGLAARLGLSDGDLLVVLGGAPVATVGDVVTVLRVLGDDLLRGTTEWIRSGTLEAAPAEGTNSGG